MAEADAPRFRGRVTFFHPIALYGFARSENGQDFYLPARAVKIADLRILKIGDIVEFSVIPPGGLPRADEIELIDRGR